MKVSGLIMSANGELIHHEFKGPPTIEHWSACWEVFMAGMIMLNACSPPYLLAYGALIAHYARRYGPQCWALIYQVETRFRREYMERARRRASTDLDASIIAGNSSHEFDPARPWEYVFKRSAGDALDPSAARYWHLNLEEPCLLIVSGARRIDGFIDGDASVCTSSAAHMATQGSPAFSLHDAGVPSNRLLAADRRPPARAPPAKRSNRALEDTPVGAKAKIENGKFTTNRAGHGLCSVFNSPAGCPGLKKGNPLCPKDSSLRHHCSNCLSCTHGSHECKSTAAPSSVPSRKGGGKGKRG
jgi:hypothetical protein